MYQTELCNSHERFLRRNPDRKLEVGKIPPVLPVISHASNLLVILL